MVTVTEPAFAPAKHGVELDQVEVGRILWAYCRGFWRLVRVTAKARKRVRVAFVVRGVRLARQDVTLSRLALERPRGTYNVTDTPAPSMDTAVGACQCEHESHEGAGACGIRGATVARQTVYGGFRICSSCAGKGHMPEVV